MQRLSRFLQRPWRQKFLLLHAASLLMIASASLRVLGFARLRRMLDIPPQAAHAPATPESIAAAVSSAAQFVPGATCLVQALVAERLLHRAGYAATLRIGVTKADGHSLAGHAWVECGGTVLIGGSGSRAQYQAFPEL